MKNNNIPSFPSLPSIRQTDFFFNPIQGLQDFQHDMETTHEQWVENLNKNN
jgi:hypothetical protein